MEISIFSSVDSDLDVLAQLSDWDTDSDAEDRHRASSRKIRRVNYMQSLDDAEFTFRFRLSKPAFTSLLMKLMPFIRVNSTKTFDVWKRRFPVVALTLRLSCLRFRQ
ncbi:unnamed protein product [Parnassius apollo]|uniref:(apollo) hypothetical protein n=1 Tax=Parnassius apollo TaxID=110799 RepID=A0A8S3VY42_PARAO|nr:unnamed protein product [Parnassius apollo]